MKSEWHIVGVPGGGKTEFLVRFVQDELLSKGVPPEDIFVIGFTVAAAREFGRRAELPLSRVSTLHSLALHAMGLSPDELAHSHLDDWNARYPMWPVVGGDDPDRWGLGDRLLSEVARLRGQGVPPQRWPGVVGAFSAAWEAWKDKNDLLDFVDLIDYASTEKLPRVRWIIIDEAQDLSPLEMRTVRRWAANAHLVLAGDPNQMVFAWRGAGGVFDRTPNGLIQLTRSYRLPRRIAERAMRVQAHHVPIEPVREGGEVVPQTWDAEGFEVGLRRAGSGTLMLLGTARYFLKPVIRWAIEEGIPIGNPYAPDSAQWNPLVEWCPVFRAWTEGRLSYRALLKLIKPLPSQVVPGREDLKSFVEFASLSDRRVDFDELKNYLPLGVVEHVRAVNVRGLLTHMNSDKRASYPFRVLLRYGVGGVCSPRVIVGTIHAVKGGEADITLVNFALTKAAAHAERVNPIEIRRLYYVGATRGKRALFYTAQGGFEGRDYHKLRR